jgi:homocysteine S-methyltransferase
MTSRATQPVLLDGGLATELEAAGQRLDTALWSAALLESNPVAIVAAHRAYLEAGAEIVTSASYQASREGYARFGIGSPDADRLIASSVILAREACAAWAAARPGAPARRVAASVGPWGAILHDGSEYTGAYGVRPAALRRFHAPRLAVLDAAGADLLAVETIPSHAEAEVLAGLLDDCRTPAWVSFSCRDEQSISDGSELADVARLFSGHRTVFALGINCTAPHFVPPLIRILRDVAPDLAVVVYPNSGEVYDAAGNAWSGSTETDGFVAAAEGWFAAGATYIGGCCRIGPTHIAKLRARWPELRQG